MLDITTPLIGSWAAMSFDRYTIKEGDHERYKCESDSGVITFICRTENKSQIKKTFNGAVIAFFFTRDIGIINLNQLTS